MVIASAPSAATDHLSSEPGNEDCNVLQWLTFYLRALSALQTNGFVQNNNEPSVVWISARIICSFSEEDSSSALIGIIEQRGCLQRSHVLKVPLPAQALFSLKTEHFHVPDTVYLHTRKEKEREAENQIAVDCPCPPYVTGDGKVPP